MNYIYIFAACAAAYATVRFIDNIYDINKNHNQKKSKTKT